MKVLRVPAFALALALGAPLRTVPAAEAPFPVVIRGGDESSFVPAAPKGAPIEDSGSYDAVIAGGGPAGMTAALYLSDRGRRVLLLEKEEALGGLAAGGNLKNGIPFDRGVAYWTSAYEEETKILDHIGLGDYKAAHAIREPTDSYLWNGRLYVGIWDTQTLRELPSSFALFKRELELAFKADLIPNQPIEEAGKLELDSMTAAEWVRKMPAMAALRQDEESRSIYARFEKDPAVQGTDPMRDVIGLMDLYCRSALGGASGQVSATAFSNFYISEIETRYTAPLGTGEAASLIERLLRNRAHLVNILTRAPVLNISQSAEGVEATYLKDGKAHRVRARYAVFAAQLKFAPRIIEGLSEKDPERAAVISGIPYSHYSVHVVFVKGHPYRASYDTWTRASDYAERDFTDVILGRWMDPAIRGYEGLRDFKKDPPDEEGIFTVYHPFLHPPGTRRVSAEREREHVVSVAREAVQRMIRIFSPVLQEKWGTSIQVRSVETNRWPYSIHVAKPGHFARNAKILRRPFGRVFFANNNIGTPAFEEALFRGHCAANNVLRQLEERFEQESWSRCPAE